MYYVSPLGGGPWTGFKKYDKFCIEIVLVESFYRLLEGLGGL